MKVKIDEIYEALTEGQRAYLFNKILKNEGYSPMHTNVHRMSEATTACAEAQGLHKQEFDIYV